ncbi:hypothetical protein [Alkalihalobacterium alkalinitrilicum]|uniref:hypothetical protein n=1 Tax=Alkalihalobacterium alkalinitrilicum TaxID=427920 RepID=UPI000995B167|nr:hypothetical protein [Alkalihalobacterium alkalinitrilicum]
MRNVRVTAHRIKEILDEISEAVEKGDNEYIYELVNEVMKDYSAWSEVEKQNTNINETQKSLCSYCGETTICLKSMSFLVCERKKS